MLLQSSQKRVEIKEVGDIAVVYLKDCSILDSCDIQIMSEQLFNLAEKVRKMIINFKNVGYFSTGGLNKIIYLNRKLRAKEGQLVLCDIISHIYEVFELTKMNKLFTITKTEKEALNYFQLVLV